MGKGRDIVMGVGLAGALAVGAAACDRADAPARAAPGPAAGPARGPAAGVGREAAPEDPAPRTVRVVPAERGVLAATVLVNGTLAAEEQVVVGPRVAGRLGELPVDLGSRVRKGDVVARLDPTDFRLRVEQAEAGLRQARARLGLAPDGDDDHVRAEDTALVQEARAVLDEARLARERRLQLWDRQLIARAELDTAVAAALVAEGRYQAAVEEIRTRQGVLAERRSELALARQQLTDSVLRAPIDGAVSERRAAVGEYLAPGTPVVTLVQVHPLRLRLAVPEREAAGVRVGQAVTVHVEGDPAAHAGRVARLSPTIQEQTRALLVEAEVPNADGRLRPGAFARAEIATGGGRPVVIVPATAVVPFAGIEKVLTVRDGKTEERRVRTGRPLEDRVPVLEGLDGGELVVVEPGSLTGGQPVTVAR
jgi:RND family efflux transporter MFP subunit